MPSEARPHEAECLADLVVLVALEWEATVVETARQWAEVSDAPFNSLIF